jgi:hypothetical protein
MKDLLPPPNLNRLISRTRPSPALLSFCDFAEGYLAEEKPGEIPARFRLYPRNQIVRGLWAELYVALEFWSRWVNTPKEEDIPENFPKGLGVLVTGSRVKAIHTIGIVRAESWAQYVEEEYKKAFDRCQKSCAAARLGHWPETGAQLIFSPEEVEKAMKDCRTSVVGVVNYGHIYRVLLSQASEQR